MRTVVVILASLLFVGCGKKANHNPTTASHSGQTVSVDDTDLANPDSGSLEQATLSPHVEPGTELVEADFDRTIRETGAQFVVVQVFAEACGPCMTEALQLTDKQNEWQEAGIAIVGLGMDATPEGPKTFFRHTGERITFPLYSAAWFSVLQDVMLTPTLFIYDADGQQLFRVDAETAEKSVMAAVELKLLELLAS